MGQGGWIAYLQNVNLELVVTDGDYFRLLIEGGIIGSFTFLLIIFNPTFKFFKKTTHPEIKYSLWVTIALCLQMVGSNISELYFSNFLFWLTLGLNYKLLYPLSRFNRDI
jgi:hypothetical protein